MRQELEAVIAGVVAEKFGQDVTIELTRPDEQFGDFATNVALQLSAQVGQNPREIAEALQANLQTDERISEVSVAGPGFLNIRLTDAALLQIADSQPTQSLLGKTFLVEYSDPNPFKPLHAGHLYTTLVGDTIARLVSHAGAQTTRINYGGDVGLHVGKSMWAIVQHLGGEHPEKLDEIPEHERATWLGLRYVEGNNAYEDDEAAKLEIVAANKRVYGLHTNNDHDSSFAHIYWTCRQWSYDYFAQLYQQLQVVPFDRYIPESEVTPLGLKTVEEQLEAGVYEKSGDAVIFDGDKFGLHTRVFINSEGIPTYEAKDVGLSLTKWQQYHFDESIIITAAEQQQYMQVVLKSIEQFAPEAAQRTKHMTHGVVKLAGGIKMSSRKGNIVSALEILDAARTAGLQLNANTSEDTVLAAVKYAFVKNRIGSDIMYDPVESIALEGNSGPYLQYAHARAKSILSKSTLTGALSSSDELQAGERSLLRKLGEFSDVQEHAASELMPHYIATYLYELSQTFNHFYEHNRAIGDPREAIRLSLIERYASTLKSGLELLGIQAPDTM